MLVPDGHSALSVYTAIENTPIAAALADALDHHLGPGASSVKRSELPFPTLRRYMGCWLRRAFRDVVLQTVRQIIRFTSRENTFGSRSERRPWLRWSRVSTRSDGIS